MLRIVFFAALGLLAGAGVATLAGPSGAGIWAFPTGLTVAILAAVLGGVLRSAGSGGLSGPDPELIAAARRADRLGLARVDAFRASGIEVNGRPLLKLEVTVLPRSRAPFRTTARPLVSPHLAGRYAPGSLHVVALLTPDGAELAFLDDDPSQPPWARMRVPEASGVGAPVAPRRGKVRRDGTVRRPLLSGSGGGLWWGAPLYLLAFVAGAVAVIYPYRAAVVQSAQSLRAGDGLHPNLLHKPYLSQGIRALADRSGSPVASEVVVRAERIDAEIPLVPGQKASDDWAYACGSVDHRGASTIQPERAQEQFRLDAVAWDKLEPFVERAARESGLPIESALVSVRRDANTDIETESFGRQVGPVKITIVLRNDYGSAFFTADAKGGSFKQR